mgnify:CR=1 FL=1
MREESRDRTAYAPTVGITPAHAGRMRTGLSDGDLKWDHPRACGKNSTLHSQIYLPVGSPPRMREEYKRSKKRIPISGITPAHAGRILKNSINIAILYQLLP